MSQILAQVGTSRLEGINFISSNTIFYDPVAMSDDVQREEGIVAVRTLNVWLPTDSNLFCF